MNDTQLASLLIGYHSWQVQYYTTQNKAIQYYMIILFKLINTKYPVRIIPKVFQI